MTRKEYRIIGCHPSNEYWTYVICNITHYVWIALFYGTANLDQSLKQKARSPVCPSGLMDDCGSYSGIDEMIRKLIYFSLTLLVLCHTLSGWYILSIDTQLSSIQWVTTARGHFFFPIAQTFRVMHTKKDTFQKVTVVMMYQIGYRMCILYEATAYKYLISLSTQAQTVKKIIGNPNDILGQNIPEILYWRYSRNKLTTWNQAWLSFTSSWRGFWQNPDYPEF